MVVQGGTAQAGFGNTEEDPKAGQDQKRIHGGVYLSRFSAPLPLLTAPLYPHPLPGVLSSASAHAHLSIALQVLSVHTRGAPAQA